MASSESNIDDFAESSALGIPVREPPPKKTGSFRTICILLVLLGLQNMAIKLMNLPLNRLIELRYCQEYYTDHDSSVIGPDGNIPESLCKIDSIQQRLSLMQGMIENFPVIF